MALCIIFVRLIIDSYTAKANSGSSSATVQSGGYRCTARSDSGPVRCSMVVLILVQTLLSSPFHRFLTAIRFWDSSADKEEYATKPHSSGGGWEFDCNRTRAPESKAGGWWYYNITRGNDAGLTQNFIPSRSQHVADFPIPPPESGLSTLQPSWRE